MSKTVKVRYHVEFSCGHEDEMIEEYEASEFEGMTAKEVSSRLQGDCSDFVNNVAGSGFMVVEGIEHLPEGTGL